MTKKKKTNPVGRPPKEEETKQRILWLTKEADEKLNELATQRQKTRSEIAISAIVNFVNFELSGAQFQDLKDERDAQKKKLDKIRALIDE